MSESSSSPHTSGASSQDIEAIEALLALSLLKIHTGFRAAGDFREPAVP